ncbi:hypothetical protein DL767_004102 [Monosporascus sp. MG133]|nr:hypothetical protein DL767_004102 [Monosporascus sp. MG133]
MQYKITIITGRTSSLGRIAKKRPQPLVVLSSRTNREQAADMINKALRQSNTIFLPLDLGYPPDRGARPQRGAAVPQAT